MKVKKKYKKPKAIIKKFILEDIISSSGVAGGFYIGGHEYRY